MTDKTVSTQTQHPTRATWRTAVQTAVSIVLVAGVVAPAAVAIIGEELGDVLPEGWIAWLIAAAAVVAAVAAALARIMAISAVDRALARLGLSSAPLSPFPEPAYATGDRVELVNGEIVTIGAILMEPNVEMPSYQVRLSDGMPSVVHESEIVRHARE
jgi:hypothetical protein